MSNRASYREDYRTKLGILTPRQEWLLNQSLGMTPEELGPIPPYGAQPSWDLTVTNAMIDSYIVWTCAWAVRECRVPNAFQFTDIDIPAFTPTGPMTLQFSSLEGIQGGSPVRIRRSYWFDGQSYSQVQPVLLSQLDVQMWDYLNEGPGIPTQIALEGDLLYLIPGPQMAGTLRLTIGSGALAPLNDTDGYDGIPTAYDDALNIIGAWGLASSMSANTEMQRRAQMLAPLVAESRQQLMAWWDNTSLDEFLAGANYRTPGVIRYTRRS